MEFNQINTQVLVETPEGVDLQAEPAGIVVRALAFAIDFVIRIVVCFVFLIVFIFAGEAGIGLFSITLFLITWFYNVLFEVLKNGQTPGKKVMNIAVVHDDLTPVTWSTSIIRNLIRFADCLPFLLPLPIPLYLVGMTSMLLTKNFRRIGDIAAGTIVIYRDPKELKFEKVSERPHAPPVNLERDDQIAVIGFAQRQNQLSDDRQQELANILGPILPVEESRRVQYVRGIGQWLLGGR